MKTIKIGLTAFAVLVAVTAAFVGTQAKTSLANFDYVLVSGGTIFPNVAEEDAIETTGCSEGQADCALAYLPGQANVPAARVPIQDLKKPQQ